MSVPHLRIPFRIGVGGQAETVEQDSIEEVTQCVKVLVATNVGSRVELPEYGIADPVFTDVSQSQRTEAIAAQLKKWEPRARADVTGSVDFLDALIGHITIGGERAGRPSVYSESYASGALLPDIGFDEIGCLTWADLGDVEWGELGDTTWGVCPEQTFDELPSSVTFDDFGDATWDDL